MPLCLRARLLTEAGFRHGFSLRTGGVSRPPFAELNLARDLGDDPASVRENHRRFAACVGYREEALFEVSQVHGAEVEIADPALDPSEFRRREADALIARTPGTAVGIRVADCVPILVAHPQSGAVMAIHAGWRGVVAGVVGAGIEALQRGTGADSAQFLAAIGPHIGPEAFEVGPEVASELGRSVPEGTQVVIMREPRPHADLGRAVHAQLVNAGLDASRVEAVGGCTYADAQRFFSFRRDGKAAGRHLAAIVAGC